MVQPTEFPAYLKIEAKSEGAFPQLEMDIAKMGENMKRGIGRNLQEIEQMISSAMSRPRNISGALDLGSAEIRAAAEASLARAAAAKEMATATMQAAKQQGELTQESLRSIAALEALERKERDAAAAANAQADAIDRVQQALDRQTTSVNALQYAEQARAGRVEVQQRNRQAGLNEVFAPGLTRRAVDNGAGFSALEGLARQQAEAEQAAAAMLRLQQAEVGAAEGARILEAALKGTALEAGRTTKSARDSAAAFEAVFQAQERAAAEMLALQRAEAGAAEGARILAAALQGTALASDRTTKSARESAAVFEQAFAAQERAAREAAAAQQVLAASAAQLRAELDPMFAAQQRFNTALDRAEELLKAGAITTREYEQAQAQARQQLQAHAQALFQVETAQGRGTTATRINTESQRANRFAMIQAGQQLQDITVSLQSGQRATTVFAQQLPQLAFAFTDVGGKVGAFAQFLAGPWGVAVFGAVTALGFLIEALVSSGDAADKETGALDFQITKVRELEAAIKKLNDAKVKQMQTSFEAERQALIEAEKTRLNTIETLKEVEAKLALAVANARLAAQAERNSADNSGGVAGRAGAQAGRDIRIAGLETDLEAARKALKEAERGVRIATRAATDSATDAALDPAKRVQREFEQALSKEQKLMDKGSISAAEYAKRRAEITRAREAELKVIRETEKATRGRGASDPGETTRFLMPVDGGVRSAPFGQQRGNRRHAGVDIAVPVGTAVRAPAAGTIIEIGNDPGGYGNYVIIDHGRGTKTRYAHLLQTTRSRGSAVTAGEVFARSGGAPGAPGSGNSRGAHLHYEVLRNGKAVDPMKGLFPTDSLNVAREAEQALEQLAGRIQAIQNRFDPATKAANDFADALATIKEAEGSGLISERESFDLQIKAMAEQYGEMARIQREMTDQFMRAFEPQQLRSAAEEYADYLEQKWEAAQSRAANAFVTAVETADFLSALFRGRVGARDVFRLINPNDSRLRTGGTAGDSAVNRFLFGKASNSIELAQGKPEIQGGFLQSYTKSMNDLKEAFSGALEKVLGKGASNIGGALGKAFAGAEIGGMTSDLLEGLGVQNSKLGSQIGGAIGSAFGPIGSLIGSVIGGLGVEALKPAKRGSATIGGSGGNLIISSTRGNSQSRIKQSTQTADEAITTLERIAQALGGTIDASRGAVSIGVREKNFRVDTTGRGITKTKKGAVDFGDDSAAAIRFATLDLIQDGVVQGIRASTQRVLQSGKDLESAIARAVDFQSVFDRLQERVDPVGAAITRVDREFARLRDIFGEAAASAEEYADLEKLFQLERADAIREANDRVLGSMKALLDDLQFGDNGRSLRDRLAAAQAKFDPLMGRVQAGDLSAYDDFTEAARALLDIQRQFSGSQTAFFELQDKITAITAKVVEGGNVTSILSGSTPTAQQQAQQSYDGSNVVNAIDQLGDRLVSVLGGELRAINDNTTGGPTYSGSGGGFNIPGFFAQQIPQI